MQRWYGSRRLGLVLVGLPRSTVRARSATRCSTLSRARLLATYPERGPTPTLDPVRLPTPARQRRRLRRWIAAIALIDAADRSAKLDTPETNAMALLSAHAAAEALLGLIVGYRNYERNEDIPFPKLIKAAVNALSQRRARALAHDLLDDLDAMHRARNRFVHAASAVHTSEADQAISSARELVEHIPGRSAMASGVADAVADIIDINYVSMWLQHAEDMLRKGRVLHAADGLARALDGAIHRTRPRLVDRHDRQMSGDERIKVLREMSRGGPRSTSQEYVARAIESLSDWVLPLALGLPPSGYAATRAVIGYESRVDLGGVPVPVDRPQVEPTADDVRRAAGSVSVMIFELWATGTLAAGRADDELIRLAQPFITNPRGVSAGERGVPTPSPDTEH